MAEPLAYYVEDIKKYAPAVNEAAVQGIVKHLGIALHKKDSSLVSASDPTELARVRDGFMKKKMALTHTDAELDAALKEVLERLKADRTKERVTVCYLLAEKFGKLDLFVKA
ncbi:MAG TPA: hypothetical protein DCL54_05875 [Alphaproteobacteria bacterium]|nr:hypothetical protein [Alphaproteobacteria bacterium]HAJ46091.1 hypothetical protein [Alphaproteobacteria bacterium]